MGSVDGLQTHVVENGNGKIENNGFQHVNLCYSPLAYTERVSFSPASWCLCRIPEPQHRPGEQSQTSSHPHVSLRCTLINSLLLQSSSS